MEFETQMTERNMDASLDGGDLCTIDSSDILFYVYEAESTIKWNNCCEGVSNPSEAARTYSSVWDYDAIGNGHARSMLYSD